MATAGGQNEPSVNPPPVTDRPPEAPTLQKRGWLQSRAQKIKAGLIRRVWKRTASDLAQSWIDIYSHSAQSTSGPVDRAAPEADRPGDFEIDVAVITGVNLLVLIVLLFHLAEADLTNIDWAVQAVALLGALIGASLLTLMSIWRIHRINSAYKNTSPLTFSAFCLRPKNWKWSILDDVELDPPSNGG